MITINTLKTHHGSSIKVAIDETGCMIQGQSMEAGIQLDSCPIVLNYEELKSLNNILETAMYGIEEKSKKCGH